MVAITIHRKKNGAVITGTILVIAALAACSSGSGSGGLTVNKQTLASCPASPLASRASIDVSGTVRSDAIPESYAAALQDLVRRTAVCGGHLSVVVFSASSAATVSLYDGDLQMPGSTENARLRRVPQATEEVMTAVSEAYTEKARTLTPGGTDIVAQYQLGHEYLQQLGGNRHLNLVLLTDGYQNAGFVLGDRALTEAEATALAAQVDIPQLPGATITVAGIGKTAGQDSAPTNVITGMKAFYDALCSRTGATTCVSVTDYTPAGG
ncbi:hypothetical protein [Arthrobacter sp. UYCu723]